MTIRLLTLACVVFLLSACAISDWDPTRKVNSPIGHVPGSREAAASDADEASTIALGDELQTLPAEPPKDERFHGTGTFVKRIAAPAAPAAAGDITLNFDNSDLREVVKVILGDLLNLNYIMEPGVQGAVTMQTGRPLSRELLIPTLETLLRMNNAVLVKNSGMYRVMPQGSAMRGVLVPQLGDSRRPLPQGYSVRIVPLKYIGVLEMSQILKPMAPEGSVIRTDTVRNLLVLAGTNPELNALLDTIEVFDVDWIKGLSVGLFHIKYSTLDDVTRQLDSLFAGDEGNPLAGLFKVVPVASTNSLLVITPQESYLDEVARWIKRLDQAGAEGDSRTRLYVYRVQHGDAENLANLLSTLFTESQSTTRAAARVAPGLQAASINAPARSVAGEEGNAGQTAAAPKKKSAGVGGGAAFVASTSEETGISIVADTVNNSLLIQATPLHYRDILDALEQLDILPLQVLVEATIVEVSLTGGLEYGLSWFFQTNHGDERAEWNLFNLDKGPGFNWSLITGVDQIRAVFSAFARDGLVNILSSPSVMVLDNQTAKIQVGDSVPVLTSSSQSTIGTDSPIVNSVSYRDTGVMLTVTPRVTPGGLVIMDVEQDVSQAVETETGVNDSPTIKTRNITSTVAVKHGQAVILGGLIEDSSSTGKGGVPGLYNLPAVGWMFGERTKEASRKELVVVLTPRVITDEEDIEAVTEDFRVRLQGLREKF